MRRWRSSESLPSVPLRQVLCVELFSMSPTSFQVKWIIPKATTKRMLFTWMLWFELPKSTKSPLLPSTQVNTNSPSLLYFSELVIWVLLRPSITRQAGPPLLQSPRFPTCPPVRVDWSSHLSLFSAFPLHSISDQLYLKWFFIPVSLNFSHISISVGSKQLEIPFILQSSWPPIPQYFYQLIYW